jgi:hypothetical protein
LLLIDTLLKTLLSHYHDPVAFYGWSQDERVRGRTTAEQHLTDW